LVKARRREAAEAVEGVVEAAVVTLVPVPAKVEAPVGVVVNEMEVVTGELAVLIILV